MLSNERIYESFCNADDVWAVLYRFEEAIKTNLFNVEDVSDDKKKTAQYISALSNSYKQKIFVKLNYIFRRQLVLSEEEASNFYNDEDYEEFVFSRFTMLYDIIEYINNDMGILYIPDKLTICAYFRISADLWTTFINYGNLKEDIKKLFVSVEEFIISSTTTGIENGLLNASAWRKLELKGKYGGNEVGYSTTRVPQQQADPVIEKQKELEHKLKNKYDFILDVSQKPEDKK